MKTTLLSLFIASLTHETSPCFAPIDLMIVQDTTESFFEDLPNVAQVMANLVTEILNRSPGSLFGIAEFKDKPYRDMGEPDDFCYKLSQGLTNNVMKLQEKYSELYASGGGDKPKAQLHALINVAQDPNVKWRNISNRLENNYSTTTTAAKIIVLLTDAPSQNSGDYNKYNGVYFPEIPYPEEPTPPKMMLKFPSNSEEIDTDDQCRYYDYPTMEQTASVLKSGNFNVVFLIPEAEEEALKKWHVFNEHYLHQPPHFIQYIKSDSSDVLDVMLKALGDVTTYLCNNNIKTMTKTTTDASNITSFNSKSSRINNSTYPARNTKILPSTKKFVAYQISTSEKSPMIYTETTENKSILKTIGTTSIHLASAKVYKTKTNTSSFINSRQIISENYNTNKSAKKSRPALLIKMIERPQKLDIHYEK